MEAGTDLSAAFSCPYCEKEVTLPEKQRLYTCKYCGQRYDLELQFTYLRGVEAFSAGQEIYSRLIRKRKRPAFILDEQEAVTLYVKAYSALQVVLQSELAESQRTLGIEMMASMGNIFLSRNLVSPLEALYWTTLMVELTAQREYVELKKKLAETAPAGWREFWRRWRWKLRQNQLKKALAEVDQKIKRIEAAIAFVDPPRARKKIAL